MDVRDLQIRRNSNAGSAQLRPNPVTIPQILGLTVTVLFGLRATYEDILAAEVIKDEGKEYH